MSTTASSRSLVQHQINNLMTKIGLLKSLPRTKVSLAKIREYNQQIKLRIKLADMRDDMVNHKIYPQQDQVEQLISLLKKSHDKGIVADIDRIREEKLMLAITSDKHIAKTPFALNK